mgnify:CR=1 FL=1
MAKSFSALRPGVGIVQSFEDQNSDNPWGWDTNSVLRSSGYGQLAMSLQQFVTAAGVATDLEMNEMRAARNASIGYYYSDLRDLGGFMQNVADRPSILAPLERQLPLVIDSRLALQHFDPFPRTLALQHQ